MAELLTLDTTCGQVVIRLRPDLAPNHVERVTRLSREGFYDGKAFFRVVEGFMAQTGCPRDDGIGGSDLPDLAPEYSKEEHLRGAVSMARANFPESANSQFFIVMERSRFLDGKFTVWGNVVEGMESVDKLKRGEPVRDPDRIVTARIR